MHLYITPWKVTKQKCPRGKGHQAILSMLWMSCYVLVSLSLCFANFHSCIEKKCHWLWSMNSWLWFICARAWRGSTKILNLSEMYPTVHSLNSLNECLTSIFDYCAKTTTTYVILSYRTWLMQSFASSYRKRLHPHLNIENSTFVWTE